MVARVHFLPFLNFLFIPLLLAIRFVKEIITYIINYSQFFCDLCHMIFLLKLRNKIFLDCINSYFVHSDCVQLIAYMHSATKLATRINTYQMHLMLSKIQDTTYYQSNPLIYLFASQRLRWRVGEIKLLC